MSQAGLIFTKAAQSLGYHPFPTPASNSSAPYTNPEGMTIGQCQYCGHCEFFGCEANAKASPLVCILPALLQDKKFELRHPGLCQPPRLRPGGEESPRRGLYRPAHRRRDRAAGRSRRALRLSLQQHAAAVDRRHRRTLRPRDRQRRGRQELLPADQFERDAVRRRRDQSVHRHRIVAGRDRRFPGRQFRSRRAWGFSAAASSRPWSAAGGRSRSAPCLPARRAGARHGRRRRRAGTTTPSRSPRTASTMRTATTISISIRPTRTRSAARWCA